MRANNSYLVNAVSVERKESPTSTITRCFLLSAAIENPAQAFDRYSFKSNGCPGMSDPRLVAKKVFGIMFDDLWAVDSTKAYILVLDGSSSTSWNSDLVTDPEVDTLLGYKDLSLTTGFERGHYDPNLVNDGCGRYFIPEHGDCVPIRRSPSQETH